MCGLRVALGIIAACGLSISIGAIVSYFPPSAGYAGGAVATVSLLGIALSFIKCSAQTQQFQQAEASVNSSTITRIESIRVDKEDSVSRGDQSIVLGGYELPHEIVLNILSYLNPKELITINLLNHQWQEIARDKCLWMRHCHSYLIPVPKNTDAAEPYQRYTKVQNLTATIAKKKVRQKIVPFDTPVCSALIDSNRAFLAFKNRVEERDVRFQTTKEVLIVDHRDGPIRLEVKNDILLCSEVARISYDYPGNKVVFYSVDLANHQPIIGPILVRLYEWKDGSYGHHIVFLKDRAFCSYRNGDIRIWNLQTGWPDLVPYSLEQKYWGNNCYERQYVEKLVFNDYTDEFEYKDFKEAFQAIEFIKEKRLAIEEENKKRYASMIPNEDFDQKYINDIVEESQAKIDNIKKEIQKIENYIKVRQEIQQRMKKDHPTLKGHTDCITHLSVIDDRLYSSSRDGMIKIWDIDAEQCIQTIATEISLDDYGSIKQGVDHFTVNGDYLFGYAYSKKEEITYCKLWNLHTGLCLKILKLNTNIDADSYCLYGNLLFFCKQTTIHAYDLNEGKKIGVITCDIPTDERSVKPSLVNLQVIDKKLICCVKLDSHVYDQQICVLKFYPKTL